MKLVVTGGRDYADRAHVFAALDCVDRDTPITLLIHGACGWDADVPDKQTEDRLRGADRWADEWARARGVPIERVAARWRAGGRHAGPARNGWLLDRRPAFVLAFPGGDGTRNCIAQALARGLTVIRSGSLSIPCRQLGSDPPR